MTVNKYMEYESYNHTRMYWYTFIYLFISVDLFGNKFKHLFI